MNTTLNSITIRPIALSDNITLARIIRASLMEFGAAKPGTVYFDPTTDALYQLFQQQSAAYFVAEDAEKNILGGGGIYPTNGLPAGTCELVKMYLAPQSRGMGLGTRLIEESIAFAKTAGYHTVYLETMPELRAALNVYERLGFVYLRGPLGNSGHHGCSLWMSKRIAVD